MRQSFLCRLKSQFLKEQFPTFVERADAGELRMLDVFQLRDIARRQDAAFEAELAGFFDARFGLGDAADFAGEADFAEENRFRDRALLRDCSTRWRR